jgi:restriction system protein
MLPPLNITLLWATAVVVLLLILFRRYRVRHGRHKRMQRTAGRVRSKILTLPGFPQKLAYLRKINPFVFEELLLDGFELGGHKIERNKRYTGDGGIDGKVWIDGIKYLVQAKRYTGHIAIGHVKEFEELVRNEGCRGFFCHTGKTRDSAKTLVSNSNIVIISGQRLLELIEKGSIKSINRG